jgi:hypothetical protein
MDVRTVIQWIKEIGFEHAKMANVTIPMDTRKPSRYRYDFIVEFMRLGFRTFSWVKLSINNALELEDLGKYPLKKDVWAKEWTEDETGKTLCEYHTDCYEKLQEFILPQNKMHGGNLSVRKEANERPATMIGHNECVCCQYMFSAFG